MPETLRKPQLSKLRVNRVIDFLKGDDPGPTVVFLGGIHGNEPAGVIALQKVFRSLREKNIQIRGSVYGLSGNLKALEKGIRYETEDLNRIWTHERLAKLNHLNKREFANEELEMLELYEHLMQILSTSEPPFYFIDLHTTSGSTSPFIVVNDSLLNRRFIKNYPLPKILGIEEYLKGALLSFINEMGYVSFGFESGQHEEPKAVTNSVDFINFTLMLTKSMVANADCIKTIRKRLWTMSEIKPSFFEITYEHYLQPPDKFEMLPGYENFQKVKKGASIAKYNGNIIKAEKQRQIFMPLYQKQGNEGFYFIKPINHFFLWLSKQLRSIRLEHILIWLPGVKWQTEVKNTLVIDTKIAKYFTKSIFHLLGYRVRQLDTSHLVLRSREASSKHKEYPNNW